MGRNRHHRALLAQATKLESDLRTVTLEILGAEREALPTEGEIEALWTEVARDAEQHVAVPLQAVDEVLPMASLTSLPETSEWVLGVLDVGGARVPIVDLAGRMGMGRARGGPDDSLILCSPNERRIGFLVHGIPRVVSVKAAAIASVEDDVAHTACVLGTLDVDGARGVLISPLVLALESARPRVPAEGDT